MSYNLPPICKHHHMWTVSMPRLSYEAGARTYLRCLECGYETPAPQPQSELDALRAENARLRNLLRTLVNDWLGGLDKICIEDDVNGGTYHLDIDDNFATAVREALGDE